MACTTAISKVPLAPFAYRVNNIIYTQCVFSSINDFIISTTHILLSTGCSCRCNAREKPKRLPGSPFFLNTFFVSKLKARVPAHSSKSREIRTLREFHDPEISIVFKCALFGNMCARFMRSALSFMGQFNTDKFSEKAPPRAPSQTPIPLSLSIQAKLCTDP